MGRYEDKALQEKELPSTALSKNTREVRPLVVTEGSTCVLGASACTATSEKHHWTPENPAVLKAVPCWLCPSCQAERRTFPTWRSSTSAPCCLPGLLPSTRGQALTTLQTWEISRELAAAKLHMVQEQGHFQLQQLALRRENTF